GYQPKAARDVNTNEAVSIANEADGASLANISLEPWQTRAFLIPRGKLAAAPAEWFSLQRSWWKGTADPGPPIVSYKPRLALDLTDDWAFKALDAPPADGAPKEDLSLADPSLD